MLQCQQNANNCWHCNIYEQEKIHAQEETFITLGPGKEIKILADPCIKARINLLYKESVFLSLNEADGSHWPMELEVN